MENRERANLAHWLSEYPNQRAFIIHPSRVRWFMAHQCPNTSEEVPDAIWEAIVKQLRE